MEHSEVVGYFIDSLETDQEEAELLYMYMNLKIGFDRLTKIKNSYWDELSIEDKRTKALDLFGAYHFNYGYMLLESDVLEY